MADRARARRAHDAGPCEARNGERTGDLAVIGHYAGTGDARGRQAADAPERTPKEGTFAGFASFKAAPKAGLYTVSLSAGAWVDVIQDGHVLKPVAFSGATACDGIRKTMKYELAAQPLVLQVSGAKDNAVSIAILPAQ